MVPLCRLRMRAAAVSSAVTFSTGVQGPYGTGADVSRCPTPPSVVDGGHQSPRGSVFRDTATQSERHYRRLAFWLGSFLRKQDPRRGVVSRGSRVAHQRVGTRSGRKGRKGLTRSCAGHEPHGLLGQHYRRSVHQQTGRDAVPAALSEGVVLPPMVPPSRHRGAGVPCGGEGQHASRRIVQRPCESGEWELASSWADWLFLQLGRPNLDLFATAENAKLPVFCSRAFHPRAWAVDALSLSWDGLEAYAFPPFALIHRVLLKIRESRTRVLLVAPQWPRQPWFPLLLHLLVDLPVQLPPHPRLGLTRRGEGVASEDPGPSPDCMEIVRNSLRAQGIPEDIASMAASARRPATIRTYNSRLAKFGGWCADHATSPTEASVVQVSKFLMSLFEEGKQVNTIKNYRSAIAAVHRGFPDGSAMGTNRVLSQLLQGMSNARPVVRSLAPSWSLSGVLRALASEPYEPMHSCSLELLTRKTLFLVAAASARRRSCLQALSVKPGHIRFENHGVRMVPDPSFLAKTQTLTFVPGDIFIPEISSASSVAEDRKWCPVRALKVVSEQD